MLKYSVGLDIYSKSINGCLSTIDNGQKVIVKTTQTFANYAQSNVKLHPGGVTDRAVSRLRSGGVRREGWIAIV